MRNIKLIIALLMGLVLTGVLTARAADEVSITGNMVCGKCTLHITDKCQNVVQVMEDGKTVNYFLLQNDTSKAVHDDVCHGDTEKVKVTGTIEEKDGKKVMTPSKIEVIKS